MAENNQSPGMGMAERRRADEAWVQERDFTSSVMEISPAGITAVDRDGHVYTPL